MTKSEPDNMGSGSTSRFINFSLAKKNNNKNKKIENTGLIKSQICPIRCHLTHWTANLTALSACFDVEVTEFTSFTSNKISCRRTIPTFVSLFFYPLWSLFFNILFYQRQKRMILKACFFHSMCFYLIRICKQVDLLPSFLCFKVGGESVASFVFFWICI